MLTVSTVRDRGSRRVGHARWRDDAAAWVTALFAANFLLMRFAALPNTNISAAVPLVLGWLYVAARRGLLAVDGWRLRWWLAGAALSALVPLLQLRFAPGPEVSLGSWALWVTLWLPTVFRFVDTRPSTFLRACRGVGWCGLGIALLSLLFVGLQELGIPYRDHFADIVPRSLQVTGFATSAPIAWGNPIHKSNAWLALEPSFLSFLLGVTLITAVLSRLRWWVPVIILGGVFSTFAGSGLALLAVTVLLLVVTGRASNLRAQLIVGAGLFLLASQTSLSEIVFGRVSEVSGGQSSSTALRATLPYETLGPEFVHSLPGMIVGYGAGSSRRLVDGTSVLGLLVPNPAKLIFDYGLIAGVVLLVSLIVAHLRTPVPALSLSILASFLFLQAATQPMINSLLVVGSLWAPAAYRLPPKPGEATAESATELFGMRNADGAEVAGGGASVPYLSGDVKVDGKTRPSSES